MILESEIACTSSTQQATDQLSSSISSSSSQDSLKKFFSENNKSVKLALKRIKHLFLIFLRQFDSEEFILLCKYLGYIFNKYKQNPGQIFSKPLFKMIFLFSKISTYFFFNKIKTFFSAIKRIRKICLKF